MTTSGDRVVVWLREAMDAAEKVARATTPVPVAWEWTIVRDKHANDDAPLELIQGQAEDDFSPGSYKSGLPVIAYAAEWQDEAEANLRHIALNDPAAVLRQIDRHRRLLDDILAEPHAVLTPGGSTQINCGAGSNLDELCDCGRDARVERQLRLLAEGYGWTEETTL